MSEDTNDPRESAWWDKWTPVMMTREEFLAEAIVYEPGAKKSRGMKPMERTFKQAKPKRIISYDLETTNIKEGTPDVLYLTAFEGGETPADPAKYQVSTPVNGEDHFLHVLENELLIKENNGVRFIAWNGNKFDAQLVAKTLVKSKDWLVAPYLTKSKSVRGMRIEGLNAKKGLKFELLDGMAMTGLDTVGMKLKKFVSMFAPNHLEKLELDFETQSFDATNPEHVRYADRDSEALYWAMRRVNEIMVGLTGNELAPTMGKAAINYFQSQMPEGVKCFRPNEELFDILHNSAKRGGYVWINKRYRGPVYKFDLNQAYAGAMRDCDLPSGTAIQTGEWVDDKCGVYRCLISRDVPTPIPFYCKDAAHKNEPVFTSGKPIDTWIMSTEVEHLRRDGWNIDISDGWIWDECFRMTDFVDNCERLRFTDPEGSGGPLGIIIKTLGNSGYGKTLEHLDGVSIVMAHTCPEGMIELTPGADDHLFCEISDPIKAPYHQPQIGCFITAHVRIQVREAAIAKPEAFLYADTDCVVFSGPVDHLDVDPKKYGKWKAESAGTVYTLIGKKIYYGEDGTKHAKGLRIKELSEDDFKNWFDGKVPQQKQLQRVNFLKMMAGQDMFRYLERTGTDVKKLKSVHFDGEKFHPLH